MFLKANTQEMVSNNQLKQFLEQKQQNFTLKIVYAQDMKGDSRTQENGQQNEQGYCETSIQ